MRHDEGVSAVADRLAENFGGIGEGLIAGTAKNFTEVDEFFAMIEQDDLYGFLGEHLHLGADQGKYIFGRGDRHLAVGLVREAASEFKDGGELRGLGRSDARNLAQLRGGGPGEIAQIAEALDHLPAQLDRAHPGPTGAEKESQNLGVAECRGPLVKQFFPGALVFRNFFDQHKRQI